MRNKCPDEERLAEYATGRLPKELLPDVEAHLGECDSCLDEVIFLKNLSRAPQKTSTLSVPAHVTDGMVMQISKAPAPCPSPVSPAFTPEKTLIRIKGFLRRIRNRLFPDAFFKEGLYALRGSRQNHRDHLGVFHMKKSGIRIQAQTAPDTDNVFVIRICAENPAAEEGNNRISLVKEGREMASLPLVNGYAVFEDIPEGEYDILVSKDNLLLETTGLLLMNGRIGRTDQEKGYGGA